MQKAYNQLSQSAAYKEDETTVSLTVCGGSYGGGSEVLVVYYIQDEPTPKVGGALPLLSKLKSVAGTLNPGGHPGSYNGQDAYNDMLVTDNGTCNGNRTSKCGNHAGGCPTLTDNHEQPILMSDRKGHNGVSEDGTSTTLTAQEKERPVVGTSVVRRLTPLECERLQGFPDGWTDIGEWIDSKGKKHKEADSPRYKALGNSIALPFWAWMARRICAQYERPMTMGSLFDGIGGFPLVFQRSGAVPVWASEIEEFPIAVTKRHFPEEVQP